MFGGSTSHSQNLGIRRCSNKVYFFSLIDHKWQHYSDAGDLPRSRRNHAAASIGRFMVIYGGCDPEGHPYNDLNIYDMKLKQ